MNEKKIQTLRDRMFHLLCYKPYNSNRNHVEAIARQLRYLENSASKATEI